ncbi:unnamed protein product [Notodromas monacha]|uniref:Myosin motor domain-containing protein n=1 Tax=Notodromas monacha TaxID=399045 RepID=A0A7R9BUK7_9CRUS|nr:unnamed protein product [Notodromas monacha]CAG0921657.1 unnamed protein product [Notodromas monacha]
MENLRVRRAGFAYRRQYEPFLERYKSLCPQTWPRYTAGTPKQGVKIIMDKFTGSSEDYQMGETKVFIRESKTLFAIEDAFQRRKHELASKIQAVYKGRLQRRKYLQMRSAVTTISKYWKRVLAKRELAKRKKAVTVIRGFIKGFIQRNKPMQHLDDSSVKFLQMVKVSWLIRLAKNLPSKILQHKWMPAPTCCQEASSLILKLSVPQPFEAHRHRPAANFLNIFFADCLPPRQPVVLLPNPSPPPSVTGNSTTSTLTHFDPNPTIQQVVTLAHAIYLCDEAFKQHLSADTFQMFVQKHQVFMTASIYFISLKQHHFEDAEQTQISQLCDELNAIILRTPEQLQTNWLELRPKQACILGVQFSGPPSVELVPGVFTPEEKDAPSQYSTSTQRELVPYQKFQTQSHRLLEIDDETDPYLAALHTYASATSMPQPSSSFVRDLEKKTVLPSFKRFSGNPEEEYTFDRFWSNFYKIHIIPSKFITPSQRIGLLLLYLDGKANNLVDRQPDKTEESDYCRILKILIEEYGNIQATRQCIYKMFEKLKPDGTSADDMAKYMEKVVDVTTQLHNLRSNMPQVHIRLWPTIKLHLRKSGLLNSVLHELELNPPHRASESATWESTPANRYRWVSKFIRSEAPEDEVSPTALTFLSGTISKQIKEKEPDKKSDTEDIEKDSSSKKMKRDASKSPRRLSHNNSKKSDRRSKRQEIQKRSKLFINT